MPAQIKNQGPQEAPRGPVSSSNMESTSASGVNNDRGEIQIGIGAGAAQVRAGHVPNAQLTEENLKQIPTNLQYSFEKWLSE
ncbi:hypothetical protein TWF481_009372 [Arthrobotrys musiformis]|uniref:Uncharacterized protein n=1 Tax=Arthrobotrys musiformis TaxID=47236 RepID=A0AAV9W5J5_9PEZI